MAEPRLLILLLMLFLAPISCARRKMGPGELERTRRFAEIIKREDRRTLGDDDFFPQNLRASTYPVVREWCAIALGRIGDPRALPWLYEAFRSTYAGVRAAAAFAVGEIEDRELLKQDFRRVDARASVELVDLLDDPSIQVRMRAVEALGKVGLSSDTSEIVRRLQDLRYDGSPEQRTYLSLAITALMRLKEPSSFPVLERLAGVPDPEIQWRCADALYRLRARGSRTSFLRLLRSHHPHVRARAARGLGICEDAGLAEILHPLLLPRDAQTGRPQPLQVRICAAQALGELKSSRSIPAIQGALNAEPISRENPDQQNFAVQAAAAFGNIGAAEAEAVLAYLVRIPGPVANSAVIALARLLKGNELFFDLVDESQFKSEAATRALARAFGELGGPRAISGLRFLLAQAAAENATSAQILAIPTVLEALSQTAAPNLDLILEPYLASQDGAILSAAVAAYKPAPDAKESWKPLIQAYQRIAPGKEIEAKVVVLNALEPWIKQDPVTAVLRSALADRQRNARLAAARLLRKAGSDDVPEDPGPSESATTDATYDIVAASRANRTVAIIETERGAIEIELYRQDAPLTAANFITLARGGFFDGLTFMRVVPYFVVQGGDPRNDMQGGPGYTIRCEINMRPYERGSVGMALSGKDTGGSQFFITLSPQPHLDGGYTCFGRVISGMPVAERMMAGDRIVKVRIVEDSAWLEFRND